MHRCLLSRTVTGSGYRKGDAEVDKSADFVLLNIRPLYPPTCSRIPFVIVDPQYFML